MAGVIGPGLGGLFGVGGGGQQDAGVRECTNTASASERGESRCEMVSLLIGLRATLLVSLKGSPTVSPTTQASCSGVPLARNSVSTTFFALSHAPPALAMKMAWYRPNRAMEMR